MYAGTEVTKYFPKEYFDNDWHGKTETDRIIKQLQDDNKQLKMEIEALRKDKTTVIKHSGGAAKEIQLSTANSNETDTAEHKALQLKKLTEEEAETRAEKQKFEEKTEGYCGN